jgi:hypothetical protein
MHTVIANQNIYLSPIAIAPAAVAIEVPVAVAVLLLCGLKVRYLFVFIEGPQIESVNTVTIFHLCIQRD